MNALRRDIRPGEIVAVDPAGTPPEYQHDRRFVCMAGFGLDAQTVGRAIIGYWYADHRKQYTKINGMEINPTATAVIQQGGQK